MKFFNLLGIFFLLLFISNQSYSFDKINRFGLGASNQLKTNFTSLSFKMQKSRTMALGGVMGFSSNPNSGGSGFGLKYYHNLFDEPQLNFYFASLIGLINNKINRTSYTGFQLDFSLGSEFHFQGLNSLGFSAEFGVSAYKNQNFIFETIGNNFVVLSFHFYL